MENITMVAGSLPGIVTPGPQRRVNKDNLDDAFLKKYIELLGKLLLAKKDLKDIKIVYIGGYLNKEGEIATNENVNTAKLYFSALSYYFKELGYGILNKSNFMIIDAEAIDQDGMNVQEKLENADFIFLGIGQDKIFGCLLEKFQDQGISIKDIILKNNTLVASVCAGSVISAENIYGGSYDTFYYNRPSFVFPKNYRTLAINPVTMEPNYNSTSKDVELNSEFRKTCLIPDSKTISFFASEANSMIVSSLGSIYAVGKISLFIEGEELAVTGSDEIADITVLNSLVQEFNQSKSSLILDKIKKECLSLVKKSFDSNVFSDVIDKFREKEMILQKRNNEKVQELKENLKKELLSLFSIENIPDFPYDYLANDFLQSLNLESEDTKEVYIKYYLIAIIKRYSNWYAPNYSLYYAIVYEVMMELSLVNNLIPYYFIQCFSSMYPNGDMKRLMKLTNRESAKRVNELSTLNNMRKRLRN